MDKRETVSKLNKKTKRCVHKKTKDNDNHFSQSSYQDTLTSKDSTNSISNSTQNTSLFEQEQSNMSIDFHLSSSLTNQITSIEEQKKFNVKYNSIEDIELQMNELHELELSTNKLHSNIKHYLVCTNHINERVRYILLDWLIELSSLIGYKRSTYHLSSVLVDLYLSKKPNTPLSELQLVGVTCLIIAGKYEERVLYSLRFFVQSTLSTFSESQIIECEIDILTTLGWKIKYPSLYTWADEVMCKWDSFSESNKHLKLPKFRGNTKENNCLYKNFCLLIDVISLDYYHLFINEKYICSSILFLLLGICLNCFNMADIINDFMNANLTDIFFSFSSLFDNFLRETYNTTFEEINQTIKYICVFFNMKFDYTQTKHKAETPEELMQIQTMNPKNQKSIDRIIKIRKEREQNEQKQNVIENNDKMID